VVNPNFEGLEDIATQYRLFGEQQARGSSATYERLALAVAADPMILSLLSGVPQARRQPNLLFGALRWHDVPVEDPEASLAWARRHPDEVLDVLRNRRTQTNEVSRCATLLPALALLPQPLALIEVGASAGLCLLYDQWRYNYTAPGIDHWVGESRSPITLTCAVAGSVPLPKQVPSINWRAGLDLNPLNAHDSDMRRWLECLVWPEHKDRISTLSSALKVAAEQTLRIERGDLVRDLPNLLEQTPKDATVVVLHSATLTYATPAERDAFITIVSEHGAHRLGAEGPEVLPHLVSQIPELPGIEARFVISLDDRVVALAQPHGRSLTWL
jgi:hypothetical protein